MTVECDFTQPNELILKCDLSGFSSSGSSDVLLPVIIGLLTALISVIGGGFISFWLQRQERQQLGQKEALFQVQEISRKLRTEWTKHMAYLEEFNFTKEDPFPESEQISLTGDLEVAIDRVKDEKVRTSMTQWSTYAQSAFSLMDETLPRSEELIWTWASGIAGDAIRKLD